MFCIVIYNVSDDLEMKIQCFCLDPPSTVKNSIEFRQKFNAFSGQNSIEFPECTCIMNMIITLSNHVFSGACPLADDDASGWWSLSGDVDRCRCRCRRRCDLDRLVVVSLGGCGCGGGMVYGFTWTLSGVCVSSRTV